MKTLLLAILTFQLFLTGCNQKDESLQVEKKQQYRFKKVKAKEDFFPTGGQLTFENKERQGSLVMRVNDLSLIKTPSNYEKSSLNIKDHAIQTYKTFVAQHLEDSLMLNLFRHKYASMLLINYEIIDSDEYETIAFLVQELISSKYGNYNVILKGLERVGAKIPEARFQRMVAETNDQIAISLKFHKLAQRRLPGLIQGLEAGSVKINGNLQKDFVVALTETDDLSEDIAKLEKYHIRVLAL